jgi:four helix bundle protein
MQPPIESFQSRGFRFACGIVHLYIYLSKRPEFPLHLARQLLKAGTSVGANLEEGKAAQGRRDYKSKISIALKEAREAHFWLRLFQATQLVEAARLRAITSEANDLVALLTATRRSLDR